MGSFFWPDTAFEAGSKLSVTAPRSRRVVLARSRFLIP